MQSLLFSFNGRIRRQQWWLGTIGVAVVAGILFAICNMLSNNGGALAIVGLVIELAVLVVYMWALLALQIKRWHDRDKSWVWFFITFVPVIGGLWALVECGFLDGTPGPNKFGPSPKGLTGPAPIAPAAT
jgi:uncharacterized membrane protein YhaH (DUF805 family)